MQLHLFRQAGIADTVAIATVATEKMPIPRTQSWDQAKIKLEKLARRKVDRAKSADEEVERSEVEHEAV